jgi:hypothetical protein
MSMGTGKLPTNEMGELLLDGNKEAYSQQEN